MKINIKGIFHERTEDAPFIGALVCSIDCHINCKDCFNQHLKQEPTQILDGKEIISIIKTNLFNKGIILAGLEWTEQPEEMKELIYLALQNNLEVILYTGLNEEVFMNKFNDIYSLEGIYIKFGNYDKNNRSNNNFQHSVKLVSDNQKIINNKVR